MRTDALSLLEIPIEQGRKQLRSTIHQLLAHHAPQRAAEMASDDDALLEPLLFLHFARNGPQQALDRILGGYRLHAGKRLRLRTRTDCHGRIHLPPYGHIVVDAVDADVELDWDPGEAAPCVEVEGFRRRCRVEPPIRTVRSDGVAAPELMRHPEAALAEVFADEAGFRVDADISATAESAADSLRAALDIVAEAWPALAMTIDANVRRVVLFRADGINSFAAPAAHGMSFHNLALGEDEIFLIEDLAHQCGHVLFATATQDGCVYLSPEPSLPLGTLIGTDDRRSLLVALHGLVTEGLMSICLDRCMDLDRFDRRQRHELSGRLAFIVRRFAVDAGNLYRDELLTADGMALVSSLVESLRDILGRRRALLSSADFGNQGYNFDYSAYAARNPLRQPGIHPAKEHGMREDAFEILSSASRLGFGGYRLVDGDPSHEAALRHALDLGCTLIDTSCNYGDGGSERLIGRVLSTHRSGANATVITKLGYLSPSAQIRLSDEGLSPEALPSISDESRYSLSPEILRSELAASRSRLGRKQHDIVLLHNPEHLRDSAVDVGAEAESKILAEAFAWLEDEVDAGRIRGYGISSNTLAGNGGAQLDALLDIARSVRSNPRFVMVQFPYNLLETEADNGLMARIRHHGLRSVCNRALNAMHDGRSIRLATSTAAPPEDDTAEYESCVGAVDARLRALGIDHCAMDFMVMQFLRDSRHCIEHPDLVDAIFGNHVAPFVAELWAEDPTGWQVFMTLHASMRARAQIALDADALRVRAELVDAGGIAPTDARPLALIACECALHAGADHVLVGMRRMEYVEMLRPLLA